jgi:uncharacterized SAM-binding protein YcdF (DUF218 family)
MRRIGSIVLAFAALAVLALAVGFVVFSDRVARQEVPDDPSAGGIVVLTGGRARIDVGLDLLAGGHAQRLLVSGVNPAVDRKALAKVVDADKLAAMSCCIDLRHDARDTAGNAAETLAWLTRHGFTSLIVVTSDYHMFRANIELAAALPDTELISYPVTNPDLHLSAWWRSPAAFGLLAREYGKLIVASIRVAMSRAPAADSV